MNGKIFLTLGFVCSVLTHCGSGTDSAITREGTPAADPVAAQNSATAQIEALVAPLAPGEYVSTPPRSPHFDEHGNLIGIVGVPYNPCGTAPCAPRPTDDDAPELRARTSIPWPSAVRR